MLSHVHDPRLPRLILSALGQEASEILRTPNVTEIRVNADGGLWVISQGAGKQLTSVKFSVERIVSLINIVAFGVGAVCNEKNVSLQAELPAFNARFQAMVPPAVISPIFVIRKKAEKVWTLQELESQGVVTKHQSELLHDAVLARKNIIIAGGTDTGKTTFANALLSIMGSESSHRVLLIEDTQELQCNAQDSVSLRTVDSIAQLRDHVSSTMRLSPDRIVIGEVRCGEALELLKAWGTGHAGGLGTVHASSSLGALTRLEWLCKEVMSSDSRELIAQSVDCVVYLEKEEDSRKVKEILMINGIVGGEYATERF